MQKDLDCVEGVDGGRCEIGGRLESRTLKALLTLDAFQVRSHRQLGWPSIIDLNYTNTVQVVII